MEKQIGERWMIIVHETREKKKIKDWEEKLMVAKRRIKHQHSDSGLNKDGNKVKKISYKGSMYTYGNVIRDK